MQRGRKLAVNTVVFAIGMFGSKVISFVMVPFYTNMLSTGQYGTVDFITTMISLFVPVLTLSLGQATIRFAFDKNSVIDHNKILSTSLVMNFFGGAFYLTVVLPILSLVGLLGHNLFYFSCILLLSLFNDTVSQYIRGIGKVKMFAVNGILTTFITVVSNVVLIGFLHYSLNGFLTSLIIAQFVSDIYLFYGSDVSHSFKRKYIDKTLLKEMTKYSVPLIPNNIMWWLINSGTRMFIIAFLGIGANGIFAVANKIPSIIIMLTSIFAEAWQLSAFEEYKSADRELYYSNVFQAFFSTLFVAGSVLVAATIPIFKLFIGHEFFQAWKIVPVLLLACIYQSLSAFLGTNFTASMRTGKVFSSSMISAALALLLNAILIPVFGINGAGIGNMVAFASLCCIRIYQSREFVPIRVNWTKVFLTNALFLGQTIVLFYAKSFWLILLEVLFIILIVLLNIRQAIKIFRR